MQPMRPKQPMDGLRGPVLVAVLLGGLSLSVSGCKDFGSQPLPSGTVNPSFYHTPAGALGVRTAALYALEQALPPYVTATGLLTDELQSNAIGASFGTSVNARLGPQDAVDARILPSVGYGQSANLLTDNNYTNLQTARAEFGQARAAIAAYDTGAKTIGDPKHLRAELFALEGYTEILLADLFCSGVPLSTLDFQGDYTYHAGSTTAQVYQAAAAHEDSALVLADTSATIQSLARVLKGRALLALNDAATAAQVVASVPDGFQYQLAVNLNASSNGSNPLNAWATVADTEGGNGLPYRSSRDPRTTDTVAVLRNPVLGVFVPLRFPSKYSLTGFSPFVVASSVEARLIEAEAVLRGSGGSGGSWLTLLNTLRTDGTYSGVSTPDTIPAATLVDTVGVTGCFPDPSQRCGNTGSSVDLSPGDPAWGQPVGYPPPGYVLARADTTYPAPVGIQSYCASSSFYHPCAYGDTMVVLRYTRPQQVIPGDTLWNPGTGGVPKLGPLPDPGAALSSTAADSARVALLFRERAFWLFVTGHRQGDLRRLLRQYPQWFPSEDHVYPIGLYTGLGTQTYGSDVTAPISRSEDPNPLFHGCLDRNP